mmetsp:Transcript_13471/g.21058  ORF Transcript_13471/g.21058 Transcript_13471/m.21058 type:complete len:303 (-) Transcript_13471:46-954(-)
MFLCTQTIHPRERHCRYKRYLGQQTDFSAVMDPRALNTAGEGIVVSSRARDRAVMVEGHDGLFLLPDWLSPEEQLKLARKCLIDYPEPPHRTNLLPHYGQLTNLWGNLPKELAELRWCTLGYQYDWTAREYMKDPPPVPEELCRLASDTAQAVGWENLKAEAVIVNYYTPSSTLGGHLDDVEPDQESPIVSVSLGCPAIFLIGGSTKDEAPTALWLRSGDVMVMSGRSRRCYHGVPRILNLDEGCLSGPQTNKAQDCNSLNSLLAVASDKEDRAVAEYMTTHRLNLNIRQVHCLESQANGIQ